MSVVMDAPAREARDPALDQLVVALGQQDQSALAQLYDLTAQRLYTVALRVSGDAQDAEEVVADVYQHAWEHARDFDPARGGALTWLSMLTWSRAVDRRRRRKCTVSISDLHPEGALDAYVPCENDSEALDMFVDAGRVRCALAQLRSEQRRLILMAFFEGASHADIAERTGMPLGTVKSHIRRGVDSLRASLEGS